MRVRGALAAASAAGQPMKIVGFNFVYGLRPAQLLESGITDAEVMSDFMNNGLSNLGLHFVLASAVTTDRHLVQRDPVGHNAAVANRPALGQGNAFVKPEERAPRRLVINNDRQIFDLRR